MSCTCLAKIDVILKGGIRNFTECRLLESLHVSQRYCLVTVLVRHCGNCVECLWVVIIVTSFELRNNFEICRQSTSALNPMLAAIIASARYSSRKSGLGVDSRPRPSATDFASMCSRTTFPFHCRPQVAHANPCAEIVFLNYRSKCISKN